MNTDGPSRTAFGVAVHRAAHQVFDAAALFADPLALAMAGFADADEVRRAVDDDPATAQMRWFISARGRFADDRLTDALANGVRQVVVLGAGLDTCAYRRPFPSDLRIFEIDHPASQAWKRSRLAEIGVPVPDTLTYVPVDLETAELAPALAGAGLDPGTATIVVWLGVLPYLTPDAVTATLVTLTALGHVDLVFDYGEPPEVLSPDARRHFDRRAARVAQLGEPWLTMLTPAQAGELLDRTGWHLVEDIDAARYIRQMLDRPDDGRHSPAHLVHARNSRRVLSG